MNHRPKPATRWINPAPDPNETEGAKLARLVETILAQYADLRASCAEMDNAVNAVHKFREVDEEKDRTWAWAKACSSPERLRGKIVNWIGHALHTRSAFSKLSDKERDALGVSSILQPEPKAEPTGVIFTSTQERERRGKFMKRIFGRLYWAS